MTPIVIATIFGFIGLIMLIIAIQYGNSTNEPTNPDD